MAGVLVYGASNARRGSTRFRTLVLSALAGLKSINPRTQPPTEVYHSLGTSVPWWSSAYISQAICNCFRLFMQLIPCAEVLPLLKAGRRRPDKIAMIAITTSNSIKVKPSRRDEEVCGETEVIIGR